MFIMLQPNLWAQPSLFFTEKESRTIHEIFSNKGFVYNEETLFLSALIYVDPIHWSLWINDTVIHAEDARDIGCFHVDEVTAESVKFSWTPLNTTIPQTFILHPSQTFVGKEQKIVDHLKK